MKKFVKTTKNWGLWVFFVLVTWSLTIFWVSSLAENSNMVQVSVNGNGPLSSKSYYLKTIILLAIPQYTKTH